MEQSSRRGLAKDASDNLSILAWTARECLQAPALLALTLAAALALTASSIIIPWFVGKLVDGLARGLAGRHGLITLAQDALALLALASLKALLAAANAGLAETLSQRVGQRLRTDYFRKALTFADTANSRLSAEDLITRGAADIETVRGFAPNVLAPLLSLALLLLFAIAMIFRLEPSLALVASAFLPFALFGLARMGLRLRGLVLRIQRLQTQSIRVVDETVRGARIVRAYNGQGEERRKFLAILDQIRPLQSERIAVRARGVPWMMVSFHAALGLVLCLGGRLLAAGQITAGQLMEVIAYLLLMQGPTRQVALVFNNLAQVLASGARVRDVLTAPARCAPPRPQTFPPSPKRLAFEGVSLVYPGSQTRALQDINFELGLGATLAVLGPPGSGKSSLAGLATGRLRPTSGQIRLDGVDVEQLALDDLRRFSAATQQSPFLFNDTIAANIAYAEPDSPAERIETAAGTSQLSADIAAMGDGYATLAGPGGSLLSGGQRQRLDLARALLPAPRLLVLDDVTTALDPATRTALLGALSKGAAERFTIVITSRGDLARQADEILFLDAGQIIERGSHERLVALKGRYWRFLQAEAARSTDRLPADWS